MPARSTKYVFEKTLIILLLTVLIFKISISNPQSCKVKGEIQAIKSKLNTLKNTVEAVDSDYDHFHREISALSIKVNEKYSKNKRLGKREPLKKLHFRYVPTVKPNT